MGNIEEFSCMEKERDYQDICREFNFISTFFSDFDLPVYSPDIFEVPVKGN